MDVQQPVAGAGRGGRPVRQSCSALLPANPAAARDLGGIEREIAVDSGRRRRAGRRALDDRAGDAGSARMPTPWARCSSCSRADARSLMEAWNASPATMIVAVRIIARDMESYDDLVRRLFPGRRTGANPSRTPVVIPARWGMNSGAGWPGSGRSGRSFRRTAEDAGGVRRIDDRSRPSPSLFGPGHLLRARRASARNRGLASRSR